MPSRGTATAQHRSTAARVEVEEEVPTWVPQLVLVGVEVLLAAGQLANVAQNGSSACSRDKQLVPGQVHLDKGQTRRWLRPWLPC